MFGNKEIKVLEEKINKLSEDIQTLISVQNSQHVDIMSLLKESKEEENDSTYPITDELYEEARVFVTKKGKALASLIQKGLGIGYSRASRLIDMLEKNGVVGPANEDLPRKIIVKEGERIN
jgi:DNA segregation ATPase FtsK/SpoIIIE, S-DNA-T family